MSTMKHVAVLLVVCALTFLVIGCGDDGVDEGKSVGDVKKDLEKMDTGDLRAEAEKYKKAIEDKKKELVELTGKIPTDPLKLSGDDVKKQLKEKEELTKTIASLTEKLQACLDKLKKEGEDISDLEVK